MRRGERRLESAGRTAARFRLGAVLVAPVRVVARRLRRWLPDGNPLRRGSDRIEAAVMGGLLVAFLVGAPLAGVAAGSRVGAATLRAQRAQAHWHQVTAVLLQKAPTPGQTWAEAQVRARWAAPDGTARTGKVYAPPGARAGSKVRVWINGSGKLTRPALQPADVVGRIAEAAAGAAVAVALVLAAAGLLVHRVIDRRRLTAWDEGWVVTEPQWTGRK